MLNDHVPEILNKQRIEQENAAMEEMEKQGAPLMWAMCMATALVITSSLWTVGQQYNEMAAQNEAMAQCLKGKPVALGDALWRCEVIEHKMITGVSHVL